MSDYRFGDDYKLSIFPKEAMDCWGEIDIDKVEAVEIEWVDFVRKTDDKSRWHELFGTPERTARTLVERLDVCAIEWCNDDCENCPYERGPYGCEQVLTLLEWLESEVRDD